MKSSMLLFRIRRLLYASAAAGQKRWRSAQLRNCIRSNPVSYTHLYLGKGDRKRANMLLEQMDPTLTARLAKQNADILLNEKYDRGFTIGLASFGNGLSKGVQSLSQTVRRIGGDDSVPEQSYSELMHGNMRSGLDGGLGFVSDVLYSTGNAAPAIAAGFVNPLAGAGVVAASTFGDCYTQARRQGKSDGEALSYGIVSLSLIHI